MFEGFIASKFANKLFEKDIYRIVRNHAIFGALIMMIPDLGFGTLFFIGILWHMYSSVCNKVGISFSEHFWSLVGVGFFVNIVIALAIDVIFSFLFFLEGFIIYFQFYMSGKLFIESIKRLDFGDEVEENSQIELPQTKRPKSIAPKTKETINRLNAESSDSDNNNLVKLDELLKAGILTEEEYVEQKNKIAPSENLSSLSIPEITKADKTVENNKISILKNLRLLYDSEVLTTEEYKKQKQTTLSVASIPWDKDKTKLEIITEMKALLDNGILTQDEFDWHKNILIFIDQSEFECKSLKDDISTLEQLFNSGALLREEYCELKRKIATIAIPQIKAKENKIDILNDLKLLLDKDIISQEEYWKQRNSTLYIGSIPWDNKKTKFEILTEMKALLDNGILTQDEFDWYKKGILDS